MPEQIQGLVFLPTPAFEPIERVLRGAFGFSLTLDQGTCRIYSRGSIHRGFCLSSELAPPSVMLTLVVPDVPAAYAQAIRSGAKVDGPPRINERFQIEHFFIDSGAGFRFEVQRFLHPWPPV